MELWMVRNGHAGWMICCSTRRSYLDRRDWPIQALLPLQCLVLERFQLRALDHAVEGIDEVVKYKI